MPQYLLLLFVLLPILGALACFLASSKLGKHVGWVAFGFLFLPTALLLLFGSQAWGGTPISESYYAPAGASLSFGFLADQLSFPVAVLVNLVLAAAAVYSMPYMEARLRSIYGEDRPSRFGLYYLNFMLVSSGLAGIVLSTNLIEIYLFVELVLIPTFVIISLFGYVQKERVGIIYIVWNQLGAFIFLGGIALAYLATGSFQVSSLSTIGQSNQLAFLHVFGQYSITPPNTPLAYWVAGLILLGWLVKMAVFGLHMWLPITEAEPPTSFAPVMAVVSGIGTYVIARLLVFGMPGTFQAFSFWLMLWAVVTMLYGGAVTVAQNDVKYLFAWSTMSQNAYSILGLASFSFLGVAGGVFYFTSHILGKFVMFAVAGILVTQVGLRDIRLMGGLAGKMPFTASLFLLGALILSAVPPTSGFQAEWMMFAGIFSKGTTSSAYMFVAVLGLIATLLTVAYTFWPVRKIFFGPLASGLEEVRDAPLTMTLPLLAIVVVSIVIGIYPDLVSRPIIGFANGLPISGVVNLP
ncbi:MAG TPA: complex I subunit 5 family protein [Nitrososphaerales archaeon]|nr:complex I subunit 5 family protein [Nitrososphaerales archaeon]